MIVQSNLYGSMTHMDIGYCRINCIISRNGIDNKPTIFCSFCMSREMLDQMKKKMLYWIVWITSIGNLSPWTHFISLSCNINFSWPKSFCYGEGSAPARGATKIPLNWKRRPTAHPTCHFGLLMHLNQHIKKGIVVLGMGIDPEYWGTEIEINSPQWRSGRLCLKCKI